MSFNELTPYKKSFYSSKFFHKNRIRFEDFYKSEKYFLTKEILKPGTTVLDIGCGSGGLGSAIYESVNDQIKYTGIDVDKRAIDMGSKYFPYLELICGSYPEDIEDRIFDVVFIFNLFEQIPEWKDFLLSLTEHVIRYMNISLTLRLSGHTVVDKDVSYGYYYDSKVRVHKIVHNIYELFNFLCIKEMRVKSVSFYGYTIDKRTDQSKDFRPLAQKDQVRGNILIELFDSSYSFERIGGCDNIKEGKGRFILRPEIKIIINDKDYVL